MAKPILITEAIAEEMAREFKSKLLSSKLSDGSVSYTQKLAYDVKDYDKVFVLFEPAAYAKMSMLISRFDSEVAWHGTVQRPSENCFVIKDILVYPQEVTGANVTTDQEEYQQWMMMLDDDTFNSLHMQGHSHVNMSVSPSTTDLTHQEEILAQLSDEHFYIFMIWNKRGERNIKIFDMRSNTMYENSDIIVGFAGDPVSLDGFVDDAKTKVVRKTGSAYQTGYSGSYSGAYGGSGYTGHTKSADTKKNFGSTGASARGKQDKVCGFKSHQNTNIASLIQTATDEELDQIDFDDFIFNRRS